MTIRTVTEVVIGVLYAMGATTQALWTLRHSEEFYTNMANRAWLPPAETFVEKFLVPNSVIVTILVVVLQGAIAIAILTRGPWVGPALIAGGVFSIVGALTGSFAELLGYSALAGLQFWLAATHAEQSGSIPTRPLIVNRTALTVSGPEPSWVFLLTVTLSGWMMVMKLSTAEEAS